MGAWYFFEIRDSDETDKNSGLHILSIYFNERTNQSTKWEFGRLVVQKGGNKPTPVLDASGDKCEFNGKCYILSSKNSYGTYDYYGKLDSGKRFNQFVKGEHAVYYNKYNKKQTAVYLDKG